jgi:hypothetical protein
MKRNIAEFVVRKVTLVLIYVTIVLMTLTRKKETAGPADPMIPTDIE